MDNTKHLTDAELISAVLMLNNNPLAIELANRLEYTNDWCAHHVPAMQAEIDKLEADLDRAAVDLERYERQANEREAAYNNLLRASK